MPKLPDLMEMDRSIDLSTLSREQLGALVLHSQTRCNVVIGLTNALTRKLQDTGELGDQCHAVLKEWTDYVNEAIARSDQEIGEIAGKTPPPGTVN